LFGFNIYAISMIVHSAPDWWELAADFCWILFRLTNVEEIRSKIGY